MPIQHPVVLLAGDLKLYNVYNVQVLWEQHACAHCCSEVIGLPIGPVAECVSPKHSTPCSGCGKSVEVLEHEVALAAATVSYKQGHEHGISGILTAVRSE